MNSLKRLTALLTALCLCLTLCACKDGGETASGEVSAQPSGEVSAAPDASSGVQPSADPLDGIEVDLDQPMYEFASGLKDGDTALTVNGVDVPNEQFFYWLSTYCYNVATYAYAYGMSADFTNEEARQNILSSTQEAVAYYAVLRQLCKEESVSVTPEQQAELQTLIETQGANILLQREGMTQEEITQQIDADGMDALLTSHGLTREQAREAGQEDILRTCGLTEESFRATAEDSYLFTNYANKLMGEPTAEDLEQYVADQKIYRVKHILLKTVDDSGQPLADDVAAEKRTQAEDLLAQLQAAEDLESKFDELMNELSEDGRTADGALAAPDGYTAEPGDMVKEFEEASLALEAGGLSGIVESTYGYHIILRLPVDAAAYENDWLTDGANALVQAAMEQADIAMADEISNLDVNEFYNRYLAYGSKLYETMLAAQGQPEG